ncbi:MAG: hypothetical protein ACO25K_07585, partial [Candidatus Fonsibacter ubiquis]
FHCKMTENGFSYFSTKTELMNLREQIQEDILSFASCVDDEKIFFNDDVLDQLCDIVVSNFNNLLNK